MTRASRLISLAGGIAIVASISAIPAAEAATMSHTLMLHGSMHARKAMGSAKVTMVSTGDYRVQITAEGLPAPEMLHVIPVRHAYLAWVIDGMDKHSMMGVIHLTWDKATSTYRADSVVMIKHVTEIAVTADKSAMQHMPTMPEVGVLDSSGKGGM